MKYKIVTWLLMAFVVVAVFMVTAVVYLSWFDIRNPPITVSYSHPGTTQTLVKDRRDIVDAVSVKSGDAFFTYRAYCITSKYTHLQSERWLVAETGDIDPIPLPLLPFRLRTTAGCVEGGYLNTVPPGTPPGVYWYKAEMSYMLHNNPIATFKWDWPDVKVVVQ